jgi:hypothetical protein
VILTLFRVDVTLCQQEKILIILKSCSAWVCSTTLKWFDCVAVDKSFTVPFRQPHISSCDKRLNGNNDATELPIRSHAYSVSAKLSCCAYHVNEQDHLKVLT